MCVTYCVAKCPQTALQPLLWHLRQDLLAGGSNPCRVFTVTCQQKSRGTFGDPNTRVSAAIKIRLFGFRITEVQHFKGALKNGVGGGGGAKNQTGESRQTSCEKVWNVLLMQETKVRWHQLINRELGRKEELFPLQGHPLFHIKCFSTFWDVRSGEDVSGCTRESFCLKTWKLVGEERSRLLSVHRSGFLIWEILCERNPKCQVASPAV